MRLFFLIVFVISFSLCSGLAQELPAETEQQLENLADTDQGETEDDCYLQQLSQFSKSPLNLNTAGKDELRELGMFTDLQLENFLSYRRLLGNIIDIYELQAVPGWDISTIRRLLPFITIAAPVFEKQEWKKWLGKGDHNILLRVSQVLQKSPSTKYPGSPQRLFFRYRYNYKNRLQFGLLGEKDGGEQFFSGAQKMGFDFYSFHLFARTVGIIQSLALGDFTVNMGQGLIQWQSLAFKKSAAVMGIKRQAAVLRPYNSAGEFNFHRGAGITMRKGKLGATAFISFRKLSAGTGADTITNKNFFTSFQASGYHRTPGETATKNILGQATAGATIQYDNERFHVGVSGVYYKFSMPLQKRDEPYNLFAINGNQWYNLSADFSYTYKNMHLFGEAAIDKNFKRAVLTGLLISADPKVDIAFLYRSIAKAYQAIQGNAFTENSSVSNETGIYTGFSIRPAVGWRLDVYADIYQFPWLRYRVDAPSMGRDLLVQLTYAPNRQTEIYTRFKSESRQGNQPLSTGPVHTVAFLPRQNWRTHISYRINSNITVRNRVELVSYSTKTNNEETGFLTYIDLIYKPLRKRLSGILRLQYFETDGYNARLYAYENDVLYNYSIPAFSGKGYRYYITLNYDAGKKISFWLRWAQTILSNMNVIDYEDVNAGKPGEIKFQARYFF